MVPGSAIAITASAFDIALAVRVVPSKGSSAMSTANPPCPTFSPMNSMGASSRSPSPITTVPSIGRTLKAARIASTAAWSASCSLPRPIWAKAAIAAASVTRTASSAKERSRGFSWTGGRVSVMGKVSLSSWLDRSPNEVQRPGGDRRGAEPSRLHRNHAGAGPHLVGSADGLQGALDSRLGGLMGDHDDGDRGARRPHPLDHAFNGNTRLRQLSSDEGEHPRHVQTLEPQVPGRDGPFAVRRFQHLQARGRLAEDRAGDAGGGFHNIGDHGAGGWGFTRP